jgi:undecaprenyl-diphosphatase
MELIQILILSVVQGVTEFLPISSSAHLILAPHVFGHSDQGLAFDVAVHLNDLSLLTIKWFGSLLPNGESTPESRLAWAIVLGTIPIVIIGGLMKSLVETDLRSPLVIACTTIGFGVLLWWADAASQKRRELNTVSWRDALFIGVAQAIAIIPGTSRSGITITAALMLGFNRKDAARFSFLLAIPTILMIAIWVTKDLVETQSKVDWAGLAIGIGLSSLTAFVTIHYFLRFIEKIGYTPFVLYRLMLGGLILALIFW